MAEQWRVDSATGGDRDDEQSPADMAVQRLQQHRRSQVLGELMVPQLVGDREEAERQAAIAQRTVLLRNLGVLDLVHKYVVLVAQVHVM